MKFETTRFGTIEIEEKQIIEFPDGLYGFEKERRFTFLPFNPNVESPMEWMQSILSPHLAFVITDPYLYVPDYKLKLLEEDKKKRWDWNWMNHSLPVLLLQSQRIMQR
jgi:flagellar assembly factor FliW